MTQPSTPGQYPTQPPAYGAMPSADFAPAAPRNTPTATTWIWIAIGISLLVWFSVFLLDGSTFADISVNPSMEPNSTELTALFGQTAIVSLVSLFASIALVVLTYLDWRELGNRGIEQRFHWAWSILSVVLGLGLLISIIGRTVVLQRQGLRAMQVLWAYLATIVIGLIISGIWIASVIGPVLEQLSQVS